MPAPRRLYSVLLIASVLSLTAGCGVKSNDAAPSGIATDSVPDTSDPLTTTTVEGSAQSSDSTTTTSASSTTAPANRPSTPGVDEQTIKDQLVAGFKTLGLTDKQAKCMADAYTRDFGTASGTPDYSKILNLLSTCNIDPSKLGAGG